AVKRNAERFPRDFIFQLSKQESDNLKSQSVISSWGGARRATPYAFTEEGVAMLSAVLRSQTAIAVSIQIMRAFVRLRQVLASHGFCRGVELDDDRSAGGAGGAGRAAGGFAARAGGGAGARWSNRYAAVRGAGDSSDLGEAFGPERADLAAERRRRPRSRER